MNLPATTVTRTLPALHRDGDRRFFEAELCRDLPSVETRSESGLFFPDGWHGDASSVKSRIRNALALVTTRRRRFEPSMGHRPLVATDRFSNGYFHWLTETLARLWWLRKDLSHYELVLPSFAHRLPYMLPSLGLFESLAVRVLPQRERWFLEDATIVPALAPTGNYRPEIMKELGAALRLRSGARAPYRKIYVSRSKAARRRIANEADLLPLLAGQGFEAVHLEDLSFDAQVVLLSETQHLVSNHGAGLTNMLFMAPGTRVTEIRLDTDTHNNCFFSLARALDLHYDYQLASADAPGQTAHLADVVVDLEAWR